MLAAVFLLPLYVGSYVTLSMQGKFVREFSEANVQGGSDVKIGWAPKFFANGYNWNYFLLTAYLPLYLLDEAFWHTNDDPFNGKYPVDEELERHMKLLGN